MCFTFNCFCPPIRTQESSLFGEEIHNRSMGKDGSLYYYRKHFSKNFFSFLFIKNFELGLLHFCFHKTESRIRPVCFLLMYLLARQNVWSAVCMLLNQTEVKGSDCENLDFKSAKGRCKKVSCFWKWNP